MKEATSAVDSSLETETPLIEMIASPMCKHGSQRDGALQDESFQAGGNDLMNVASESSPLPELYTIEGGA